MTYITRVCPYCGDTIVVESDKIPSDIIMTKRKSMTTLAHLKCYKLQSNSAYGKVARDLIEKGEI